MVELGLSELISFCKKWYIRDELCGLTKKRKKTSHYNSRAFSLEEKAPTKKQVENDGWAEIDKGTGSKIRVTLQVDIPSFEWDRNNRDRKIGFWETNRIAAIEFSRKV